MVCKCTNFLSSVSVVRAGRGSFVSLYLFSYVAVCQSLMSQGRYREVPAPTRLLILQLMQDTKKLSKACGRTEIVRRQNRSEIMFLLTLFF